jgi:flagellar protein FliO/FliZ
LIFVILVIYGLSLIIKRFLGLKGGVQSNAEIIINQALGQGKWLQVVYICGKYLVLGITNDNINLLTEIEDQKEIEKFEVIRNEKKIDSGNSFIDMISDFVKSKLKRNTEKEKFDYEADSIDFLNKQKERLDRLKK